MEKKRADWLDQSIKEVLKVKNDDPVALDVVKAANNIEFKEPNYNHGW